VLLLLGAVHEGKTATGTTTAGVQTTANA
jgi:hypothetical protein